MNLSLASPDLSDGNDVTAILLTGYLGGAVASNMRLSLPLFTYTLFMIPGGLFIDRFGTRISLELERMLADDDSRADVMGALHEEEQRLLRAADSAVA